MADDLVKRLRGGIATADVMAAERAEAADNIERADRMAAGIDALPAHTVDGMRDGSNHCEGCRLRALVAAYREET